MQEDKQSGTSRPAAVLDIGSNTIRAGFGGQTEPSVVMPSVVGRPRGETLDERFSTTTTTMTRSGKTVYVGDDAQSKRGVLLMKRFIEYGVVTNFDELEAVWGHLFDEKLRVNISATPLLVAEGESMNPKCNREKLTQIAFETFSVPHFFLALSPALILAAAGRRTGLSVDLSDITRAVPVYEGYFLSHCVTRNWVNSLLVTEHLGKLLARNNAGVSFQSRCNYDALIDITKQLAYAAQDVDQEKETFGCSKEEQFKLPDGKVVTVGTERFECAEPLFQPELANVYGAGLAAHVVNTVRLCNADIRQELLSNVVLAGGGSSLAGLASRLQKEVETELMGHHDLSGMHVQVLAPPGGDLLVWKGASLLASSPGFIDNCISSDEYEEYGPALVHRKCF